MRRMSYPGGLASCVSPEKRSSDIDSLGYGNPRSSVRGITKTYLCYTLHMNRPALSLTNGILITALVLIALFIVGGVLSTKTKTDGTAEEGDATSSAAMERQDGASTATCGEKNDDCVTSEDCCGNMGLECQQVRTSTGGFDKRCLPVEVMICKSDCGNDGV